MRGISMTTSATTANENTSTKSSTSPDALTMTANQVALPSCPDSIKAFIEETSLERLVYWKLQGLFDKIDGEPSQKLAKTVLASVERPLFALVLKKTRGNQSRAAEVLGCNRNTLHRKLKGFAVAPKDLRKALKNKDRRAQEIMESAN
jgi:DNA-binding protein Fis